MPLLFMHSVCHARRLYTYVHVCENVLLNGYGIIVLVTLSVKIMFHGI
jgi:hypothetical protein